MPDHVIEDGDFHIKAPAPIEKVLKDAAAAEAKAEDAAKPKKEEAPAAEEAAPAFVQLYRRRNLAQQRSNESESESDSDTDSTSSSDSSSGSGSD